MACLSPISLVRCLRGDGAITGVGEREMKGLAVNPLDEVTCPVVYPSPTPP